jgi:hypothetical protein
VDIKIVSEMLGHSDTHITPGHLPVRPGRPRPRGRRGGREARPPPTTHPRNEDERAAARSDRANRLTFRRFTTTPLAWPLHQARGRLPRVGS